MIPQADNFTEAYEGMNGVLQRLFLLMVMRQHCTKAAQYNVTGLYPGGKPAYHIVLHFKDGSTGFVALDRRLPGAPDEKYTELGL